MLRAHNIYRITGIYNFTINLEISLQFADCLLRKEGCVMNLLHLAQIFNVDIFMTVLVTFVW